MFDSWFHATGFSNLLPHAWLREPSSEVLQSDSGALRALSILANTMMAQSGMGWECASLLEPAAGVHEEAEKRLQPNVGLYELLTLLSALLPPAVHPKAWVEALPKQQLPVLAASSMLAERIEHSRSQPPSVVMVH